jgi:hypothetical protein
MIFRNSVSYPTYECKNNVVRFKIEMFHFLMSNRSRHSFKVVTEIATYRTDGRKYSHSRYGLGTLNINLLIVIVFFESLANPKVSFGFEVV